MFAKYFPTTVWLWRRLTSRLARRIALFFCVALALSAVGLRVNSAIFAHRVHKILGGLEQLRPDQTSKAEMLKLLPDLRPGLLKYEHCRGDECYATVIQNWPDSLLARLVGEVGSPFLVRMLYGLGVRLWYFGAKVELQGNRVHDLYYSLLVDDGSGEYPGAVTLDVGTLRGSNQLIGNLTRDESPDFQISSYRKWPKLDLGIVFAPTASRELVHHAFDLHLECVWKSGCRSARQLLPLVWDDQQRIEASALARIKSSVPCPDRILPRRARDVPDILLVEVERVRTELKTYGPQQYRIVDYRILEALKGRPNRLSGVEHPMNLDSIDTIPNPAISLVRPGARVLMFTDSDGRLEEPCEIVAATPGALRTIRSSLALPTSQIEATNPLCLW